MRTITVALLTISLMAILLLPVTFFSGCANQTYTQQISSQTSDPWVIAKAVYLDARVWYNRAQQGLIDYHSGIPADKLTEINSLLDTAGKALDAWGDAIKLKQLYETDRENFRQAKNKLVDMGFDLFIHEN